MVQILGMFAPMQSEQNGANKMFYFEVVRVHGYINEVLSGVEVVATDIDTARAQAEKMGYSVIDIDEDFERIFVK